MRLGSASAILASLLSLWPAGAGATNGHFLHGIGATQSALAGAGLALPTDALAAVTSNPALLVELPDASYEFSSEVLRARNAVSSSIGPFSGRTEEAGDKPVIPAFAWARHRSGSRLAVGMGFVGRAGFGADYPQDATNPILAPQPFGFGHVQSTYQHLDLPLAVALRTGPHTTVGASLNLARATLSAEPAGFAAPDCTPDGRCYVPHVGADSAWGVGARIGVAHRVAEHWRLAAAYSTEQRFESFEWRTEHANPSRADFGSARVVRLEVSTPQSLAAGVAWQPSGRWSLALDARWVGYGSTAGFGDTLGWRDITVLALGGELAVSDRLTVRAGLNHGGNPIPDQAAMRNVTSPAILRDHAAVGIGYALADGFAIDIAYYHAFRNEITGPIVTPGGPLPGASVTNSFALDGVVLTMRFGH